MRIQDAEASAPVHENLGEPGIADDWINDERVLSRIRDVVGVVLAAEEDGVLRPVEVGWRSLVDGEDLSALSLALSSGHVRRWSAEDEEHVLHRGEPSPPLSSSSFFLASSLRPRWLKYLRSMSHSSRVCLTVPL